MKSGEDEVENAGLGGALRPRSVLVPSSLMLMAALSAAIILHGCQREFDNPFFPRSDDYAGPAWSHDGDGDGVSDSMEKYAPGCGESPEACLRKARSQAGGAPGPDSVTAENLILVAGGPAAAPRLRWHPPGAAVPYSLTSDNPAAAQVLDSLVRPVAPGHAILTLTARGRDGRRAAARFRVDVTSRLVRVASVSAPDMALLAGEVAFPKVLVLPADATEQGYDLLTHDPLIAEVRGKAILAVSPGATRVTVRSRDGGREDLFLVTVRPEPTHVRSVKVADMRFSLRSPKDARKRVPDILWVPANPADKRYSLVSKDPGVARVAGDSIEAMRGGLTQVILRTVDGAKADTFRVRIFWKFGCDAPNNPCSGGNED